MTTTSDAKPAETVQDRVYAKAEAADAFGRRLLVAHGLSEQDAATMAGCLVRADLRGVDTHGLQFLPQYLDRLRRGLVNPKPDLEVERVTPMVGSLDGQNGYGFVVATKAMAAAIDMAREFGVGVGSARTARISAWRLATRCRRWRPALFHSSSPMHRVHAAGRARGLPRHQPVCRRSAVRQGIAVRPRHVAGGAARGKIRRAARRGEQIPLGYALDAYGRPTTDPNAALDGGVVLPIGGPKGSGISMLMDIMGGVISGAACAGDVGNQFLDYDRPQNVGHFFLAMKPDLFIPKDEYLKRMDTLVQRVHAIPTAEGVEGILMPGEKERRSEATRRRTGLPYHPKEVAALQKEATKAGLPALPVSNTPYASNTP